ncbi:1,2-phenylacetyl-CoA epoxidase subunit PaaE [Luteipulveratus mongoliensis]|uniref:Phenylacetic acid degradation protein n=1 Tax=Luteipulveratus mongoliensis TaxID=571913 RepID=A0A0K1JKU6_9MICO|nr:1,2-phenylacetyl-CoA epoxidase subunit PaaE [Luteipulveratus mongoliensis]AKU17342.1 phenylacetic acid degradation protein [Luteipulveratus mongoliensis]
MTALISTPARTRPRFHTLTVSHVQQLTDEAVAISFAVPDDLASVFEFAPGQHLTLRATIDGEDVRRSYSICLSRSEALLRKEVRVGSARVPGGVMSTWLNEKVKPGDEIEVMSPLGAFTCPTDPGLSRHHVAIAAGSGITPVLSLLASALEDEPSSRATLIFGNRRTDSIMFLEELEDLKNAYAGRFHLINVLSREPQEVELFNGRIDKERLERLFGALIPVDAVDEWYLCGPFGMVEGARELLRDNGVGDSHVHHEVFHVDEVGQPAPVIVTEPGAPAEAVVTINLDGRSTEVEMPSKAESILDATLRERPDAPFSCTGGVCGTCRARVVQGEVRMDRNYALEPEEIAAGIVLACQAHPVTDTVTLDYDA